MSSTSSERNIKDVREIWASANKQEDGAREKEATADQGKNNNNKHKYKTLERHLSMKKTIRRKMMRDLKEIGDENNENQSGGFLEQIRTDQPPPANIDKPSLWKRLTKGWSNT